MDDGDASRKEHAETFLGGSFSGACAPRSDQGVVRGTWERGISSPRPWKRPPLIMTAFTAHLILKRRGIFLQFVGIYLRTS